MRFAGLFDCKNLKAYGEAILVYRKYGSSAVIEKDVMYSASSVDMGAEYDQFSKEIVPVLGPLNFAPLGNSTNRNDNGYIPITKLSSWDNYEDGTGSSNIFFTFFEILTRKINMYDV